jgi:glycosyltransferase involved in cell wall biosynthesis
VKLVIQIPAWDEAEQIGPALAELPRHVAGFDAVETLVVDDGSTDGTAEAARRAGADHVVRLPVHRGSRSRGGLASTPRCASEPT